MGILRNIFFKMANENTLRKKSDKMFKKLIKVGFYEKENFNRIDYYDFYTFDIRFVSSNYAKSGRTAESSVRTACGSRRT